MPLSIVIPRGGSRVEVSENSVREITVVSNVKGFAVDYVFDEVNGKCSATLTLFAE